MLRRCSIWRLASLVRRKLQFLDWVSAHRHIIMAGTFSAIFWADRESLLNLNSRRYTYILKLDTITPVATFWVDLGFSMTWNQKKFWVQQPEIFPLSLKISCYDTYRIIDYWQQTLFIFKDWLESTAFIHEDLLAQTNSKFQSHASNADDSTKPKNPE